MNNKVVIQVILFANQIPFFNILKAILSHIQLPNFHRDHVQCPASQEVTPSLPLLLFESDVMSRERHFSSCGRIKFQTFSGNFSTLLCIKTVCYRCLSRCSSTLIRSPLDLAVQAIFQREYQCIQTLCGIV